MLTIRTLPALLPLVVATAAAAQVQGPVLKWFHGGCYSSWCETGWYSSPAIADLDGDGSAEVIASAYSIVVLDGASGALEWRVASGHDRSEPAASSEGRTWPGIVVADVDGDDELEIVTAHGGGWVSVYEADGYFRPGWPRRPVSNELRGLAVGDLDRDGTMEIAVSSARGHQTNTWVYEHGGAIRGGWPQVAPGAPGYSWGVYNDNVALANLDGDPNLELVVPSDVHYICSYEPNGSHRLAGPVHGGDPWGEVGVWESYATELRGWGMCNGVRAESYRTNFADGPATVADLDGDGSPEIVATGRTYDCSGGTETTKYTGVYVFRADRGRFVTADYDWTTVPVDLGAPLSLDYNVIESASYNPAVGDLDGDGELEIVYSDFSGRIHAFWLDRTEHGNWPHAVWSGSGPYRYASEPLIADLDADGTAEVLVTTWTRKGSDATGHFLILDSAGNLLHQRPIPASLGSSNWNGAMAAPTLGEIDGDREFEIVIQTAHSGVVAYDLPGTRHARLLWSTGRGSFLRAGTAVSGWPLFTDGFESGDTTRWSSALPQSAEPDRTPGLPPTEDSEYGKEQPLGPRAIGDR